MFSSKKPYTAVTVHIERLTSPEYQENDLSGIVELIEVIRIQDTGPTEAARAIRKKLKYGSADRQIRALNVLDGLLQNGGPRFQRTFMDEPLLERLRILPRDDMNDPDVRDKCQTLFRQWAANYRGVPGLSGIAELHKELPHRQRKPQASQSKVIRETEENPFEPELESPASPGSSADDRRKRSSSRPMPPSSTSASSSSMARPRAQSSGSIFSHSSTSKDKKYRSSKSFNLEKEKPVMLQAIANASITSTNLLNSLKFVNRETHRVSEDPEVMSRFEACKFLRRQVLRYIQLVESDQWIGSLLSANDELVNALMTFEVLDKSVEDDSDSDNEFASQLSPGAGRSGDRAARMEEQMAGLTVLEHAPAKPPRPGASSLQKTPLVAPPPPSEQDEELADENDPFSDSNAIK